MTLFSILKTNKKKLIVATIILLVGYLILNFQMRIFQVVYTSKVWAHRVNSIEKFEEARKIFSGIECDLVYNSSLNNFDVNHPPAKSINLTLFELLISNSNYNCCGVWLDFKNLNEINYLRSANKLDSVIKILKIDPKSIIVESSNPEFLEAFKAKGFKTSYYLPQNFSNLDGESLLNQLKFTNVLLDSNKIDFVSSDVKDYYFIKNNFPNSEMLTWIMNNPPEIKDFYTLKRSLIHFKRNFTVLNDSKVKVVLFTFKSKLGDR